MSMRRRRFLAGIATGALSVGVGACSAGSPPKPVDETAKLRPDRLVTLGNHQAGVTTVPPAAASLAALDLTRAGHDQLPRLLQLLTSHLRRLQLRSSGSSGVTVTVAVGAGLFDKRRGLGQLPW
jgi:deferrochelatase/peroxidase EfeB